MAAAVVSAVSLAPATAWAAPPAKGAGGHGGGRGGGGGSAGLVGNDISWPQCGAAYPGGQAFGIVGVNGGLASDWNGCFASELAWALGSSGASTQPKASLYVNTGDPGATYDGQAVADWPTTGGTATDPCTTASNGLGTDSVGCAWQYGYDRAAADVARVGLSTARAHPWWLDVETANTWQGGTHGLQMNIADLQGMEAAFASGGLAPAGVYSTASQWTTITGGDTTDFAGVPDWMPGARSEHGAESNCGLPPFTGAGSKVTLTQWTGSVDYDYPCP